MYECGLVVQGLSNIWSEYNELLFTEQQVTSESLIIIVSI